jgi:hypothetical protein
VVVVTHERRDIRNHYHRPCTATTARGGVEEERQLDHMARWLDKNSAYYYTFALGI